MSEVRAAADSHINRDLRLMATVQLTTAEKGRRLKQLGEVRRDTRWPGYNNVGDYHDGAYESEWVSPYTKSACNVDAELMILLQDWASDDRMQGPIHEHKRDFGYSPELSTNKNLFRLLKNHFGLELEDTFATNVMPFVKLGKMNASIPRRDMVRAAKEFAIPQIEIVGPTTAVCLGLPAFNSIRISLGHKPVRTIDEGVKLPFMYKQTEIWCQAHTGNLGTINRNRGGVNRVEGDWAAMATAHRVRKEARTS